MVTGDSDCWVLLLLLLFTGDQAGGGDFGMAVLNLKDDGFKLRAWASS